MNKCILDFSITFYTCMSDLLNSFLEAFRVPFPHKVLNIKLR